MKFYIAASFVVRDAAVERAHQLERMGHKCGATWINKTTGHFGDAINAMVDASEVMAADLVILLLDIGEPSPGKHVELGIAIASGKRVAVIGGFLPRCVFYFHPACTHYKDWAEFTAMVERLD